MLQLSQSIMNQPVMSLRTSAEVATAIRPIINPNNLKIEGFYCEDRFHKGQPLILLTQDIREHLPQGFVVNDHEVLAQPEDLIRLQKVLEIDYQLLGKQVITTKKQRVGKITDYALESTTFYIQKLYASQPLLKSMSGQLSIDRTQIVEITDKKIVVQEILNPIKGAAPVTAPAS
jgi:sporulation protein YlmC with PRC-barrel domain